MNSHAGPVDDFEFPNITNDAGGRTCREDVGTWKYRASIGYDSMDQIYQSKVTGLWWYKNVEGLEHESVVAICHRDGEINDIILRLERRPSSSDSSLVVPERALPDQVIKGFSSEQYSSYKADVDAERKMVKRTFWTTLQKTTPKQKNILVSVDTVTRLPGWQSVREEDERLLGHYHSFQKPFYVRDLAFLADAINAYEPKYQFFVNQCYWYARTVINVVVDIYLPLATPEPHFAHAGTYTVNRKIKGVRIPVNKDCQGEIEDIRGILEGTLEDHNSKVHAKYHKREGKMLEMQRALEGARRGQQLAEEKLAEYEGRTQAESSIPAILTQSR